MKLLTKEIERSFPPWMSTDGKPPDQVRVVVKFFTPDSNWTWYATEACAVVAADEREYPLCEKPAPVRSDVLFFGLVSGHEMELGYFALSELERVRGKLGLPIERDTYWTGTLADARKAHGG